MKIVDKRDRKIEVRFQDLKVGQIFECCDNKYLKVIKVTETGMNYDNCVRLSDFKLIVMSYNTDVLLLVTELHILPNNCES